MKDNLRLGVKLGLWALTVALVCFLLFHGVMKRSDTNTPIPITSQQRDSLAMLGVGSHVADTLVCYEGFEVHFNPQWHVANCATYELTRAELQGQAERPSEFYCDERVPGCASPDDYSGSGMQRGHLVPAADLKWSATAMQQSLSMANICPMQSSLNEGGWAKLENKVREWAQRDSALLIFTGPIIGQSPTTMATGVVVPESYYKVVLAPCVRPRRVIAFVYPNGQATGSLSDYAVIVDEVERLTGLDFLTSLPADEQAKLERQLNVDVWLQ